MCICCWENVRIHQSISERIWGTPHSALRNAFIRIQWASTSSHFNTKTKSTTAVPYWPPPILLFLSFDVRQGTSPQSIRTQGSTTLEILLSWPQDTATTYLLQLPHVILILRTEHLAVSEYLIQTQTVLISSDFLPSPPARMTALEVSIECCKRRLQPFSFAVRSYGIIGGGAVLFAGSALAGQNILGLG